MSSKQKSGGAKTQSRGSASSKTSHHVVPDPQGGWNVKKGGSAKASNHYGTKDAAVAKAREISRNQGSELYIHRKDGTIQRKASHGRDPNPPKDRDTHK